MIALDLEIFLEREGATSFSFAASQEEAVTAACERRPDVITSDVTLLEGTGPAAVETIRSVLGNIPVVYISGTAPNCGAGDPFTRALHKPVSRPVLAAVFQELRQLNA